MQDLSFAIPLPSRSGVFTYSNITRIGTMKIEDPGMGTTIEKNTVGAPMVYTTIAAYPATWLAGETIKITKGTGILVIDTYVDNALLEAADVGDMLKSIYDTDNDGVVDAAESVPWAGVTGKPSTFTPDTHTHAQSDVTGLTTALSNKVETSLLGANSGVATLDSMGKLTASQAPAGMGTGDMLKSTYDTDNDGVVDAAETAPWAGITGKPSVFTPDTHTHAQSDVTGLVTALSNKIETSQRGAASGVASLDGSTLVPVSQLPAATTMAAGTLSSADKTKLDGIATGATANDTDANLLNRANHTGSQAISTITGLTTALSNKVETSLLGANSGVATLDVTGKVPSSQLPAMGGGTGDMLKSTYDTDNDGIVDAAESVPWSGITSKPSVFTPDTHTHIIADVTGLQTALDGKAGALTRTTYSKTTASLANLATESGSIPVGKTISILYITLDRAARVRFYATAAIRDADVGRSIMTEPVDGCFYDVQSGGAATYFGNTGAILVYNGDTSAVSNIYYTVTNVSGSTSTVNFILGHLVMEV